MKFFIDTANLDQIREANDLGILDGVTTNPSLMAKEGITGKDNVLKHYKAICEIVGDGDVSAEVIATDYEGMIKEAAIFTKIAKNIAVKVPLTWDGLKACATLSGQGTMVNVTLCFSPVQAWMAAKAGATFISPFIGRVDDMGEDGMGLIRDIRAVYDNYGFKTEILAASIRSVSHVRESLLAGADVGTMPSGIFKALLNHPLTDKGLAAFVADAKKAGLVIKG